MLSRALTRRSSSSTFRCCDIIRANEHVCFKRSISAVREREPRNKSLTGPQRVPQNASGSHHTDQPRTPGSGESSSGKQQAANIFPSWMRPHFEVVGTAVRTFPAELSAKAQNVSRTGCLITLWELTLSLVRNLGFGYKWTRALVQLVLYATLLLPGFAQIGFSYFFRWKVKIGVPYGSEPRNFMDLYLPPSGTDRRGQLAPVVVFVTGGAWIIGYRAWGALLARRLSQRGALVCSIDYRNFPQGTIVEMLHDCDSAFQWVADNIESYGGDPANIVIVGQSAGAHISSLCLFAQAQKAAQTQAATSDQISGSYPGSNHQQPEAASRAESAESISAERLSNSLEFSENQAAPGQVDSASETDETETPLIRMLPPSSPSSPQAAWRPADEHIAQPASPPAVAALGTAALSWQLSSMRGFYGISGAYDIAELEDVLEKRGLHRSLLGRIMNISALGSLEVVSPTRVLAGLPRSARALLPQFGILHGDSDVSVPPHIAEEFADELQAAGLLTSLDMREGKSHTQVFIEDPFKGNDYMCDGISQMVFGRCEAVQYRPLVFKWLIDSASFLCPF